MTVNVYKNDLVEVPVTILNGQTLSPIINSAQLPNGSGAAVLLGIRFPAAFPVAAVTFVTSYDNDLLTYDKYFCNGTQTNQISIKTTASNIDVSIVPYFLTPNSYLRIKSDTPMTTDTTIYLNFQPIIQGAA